MVQVLAGVACSKGRMLPPDDGGAGTGGAGSGGAPGVAGSSGAGGKAGAGGARGTGGAIGTGGAGVGGASGGAGGAVPDGGVGSDTGPTRDAGTDTQASHRLVYTFDTGVDGWFLSDFPDPSLRNVGAVYPSDPATIPLATLAFDQSVGSPAPGSLAIHATFTDCNQYLDAHIDLTPLLDLTGRTVHARLQVTSGAFSGGAQLHLGTGDNYEGYVSTPFAIAPRGTFASAAIDLTTAVSESAARLDPSKVIQVGVEIDSGTACTGSSPYPDAGVAVVFNVDAVTD